MQSSVLMKNTLHDCRMKIVDDDVDWRQLSANDEEKQTEMEEEDEAPVVSLFSESCMLSLYLNGRKCCVFVLLE